MTDQVTLSPEAAQEFVDGVRAVVVGLKVLRHLAATGDREAAALLQELRDVLPQSRIARL